MARWPDGGSAESGFVDQGPAQALSGRRVSSLRYGLCRMYPFQSSVLAAPEVAMNMRSSPSASTPSRVNPSEVYRLIAASFSG
jgi:hypothetical protein